MGTRVACPIAQGSGHSGTEPWVTLSDLLSQSHRLPFCAILFQILSASWSHMTPTVTFNFQKRKDMEGLVLSP